MNIFKFEQKEKIKIIEAKEKIVMFLDILGFASLTLKNKLDIEAIKDEGGPVYKRMNRIFTENNTKNKLTEVFSHFHFNLESGLSLAKINCYFTSITFSDSAFIVTHKLDDAVTIIINLMSSFLRSGVPVRAGIALGTFEAIRFKSDIKTDCGEHASHFLGAGVVRACQTESCGIKGLRILIHPSIEELFEKIPKNNHLLQNCDGSEIGNAIGVKKEINYWDYNTTGEKSAWKMFQEMWKEAPEESKPHYEATAKAIQKMRLAKGYPLIKNLKGVSISRKHQ